MSPRRQVSRRRRTADEQAERAVKEGTLYNIPAHPNTFGALEEEEEATKVVNPSQIFDDSSSDALRSKKNSVDNSSQILGEESSDVGRQESSTELSPSGSTRYDLYQCPCNCAFIAVNFDKL